MPIQLPPNLVHALPLALYLGIALATAGLALSLLAIAGRHSKMFKWIIRSEPERMGWRWMRQTCFVVPLSLFWLLVSSIHLLGWHICLIENPGELHGVSYVSSLLAAVLGWRLWQSLTKSRLKIANLLVMQTIQIAGLFWCANLLSAWPKNTFVSELPPGELVVVSHARTDRGTPIRLYTRQVDEGKLRDFYFSSRSHIGELARFAMFRKEAVPNVNCHGWVFSGQHIIKGEDIPTILSENGYSLVDQPELNDLAIYRDFRGDVVHTGVVRGFLGAAPLIESKWGIAATYVHHVEQQPYSSNYKFYRSSRAGHGLQSCQSAQTMVASLPGRSSAERH